MGNFLQKYCLWPKDSTFCPHPHHKKWGSILLDYFSPLSKILQNGSFGLKLNKIGPKLQPQKCTYKFLKHSIAAYEPGSLLISYSGSEFYHDGYLRSSTIVLCKLANKVVDVEVIRRETHVRGKVVCVSEAVRVETSRVRFRSLVNSCAKKCLCQDPFGEGIPNTPINPTKRYSNFNVFLPTRSHQL